MSVEWHPCNRQVYRHLVLFFDAARFCNKEGMNPTRPTLFVLEDSQLFQQMIRHMLLPFAGQTFYFSSGESLLLQLPANPPDLAILDYNLEGEMTGLDTLLAMREQVPQLPVILFSTCTDLPTPGNFLRFGPFEFVEKNAAGISILRDKVLQTLSGLS